MKVFAVYKCGHDAIRNFDGRNSIERSNAKTWEADAAEMLCPKCAISKRTEILKSLSVEELRKIIRRNISYRPIAIHLDALGEKS